MKILLVAPSQSKIYGNLLAPDFPSLGLGYLGAVLEKFGHIVNILDIDAGKVSEQDFIKSLKTKEKSSHDMGGVTCI